MVGVAEFHNPVARIALFRVAVMLLVTFYALIAWVVLRLPSTGLTSVFGPVLVICSALAAPDTARRSRNIFLSIFLVSLLQFGRGWLSDYDGLSLLFVILASLLIHKLVKSPVIACGAMIGGLLDTGPVDFATCANAAITFWVVGLATAWSYFILEKCLPVPDDRPLYPEEPPLDNAAIFRRTLLFAFASFLVQVTRWEESFWVMIAIGIPCSSALTGKRLRAIALTRGIWTPIGLFFTILYMQTLPWIDFKFNYLLIFIGIVAFYILYRFDNYPVYYTLFILLVTCIDSLTNGHHKYGNPLNYLTQASVCVLFATIGIFLIEPASPSGEDRIRQS